MFQFICVSKKEYKITDNDSRDISFKMLLSIKRRHILDRSNNFLLDLPLKMLLLNNFIGLYEIGSINNAI